MGVRVSTVAASTTGSVHALQLRHRIGRRPAVRDEPAPEGRLPPTPPARAKDELPFCRLRHPPILRLRQTAFCRFTLAYHASS